MTQKLLFNQSTPHQQRRMIPLQLKLSLSERDLPWVKSRCQTRTRLSLWQRQFNSNCRRQGQAYNPKSQRNNRLCYNKLSPQPLRLPRSLLQQPLLILSLPVLLRLSLTNISHPHDRPEEVRNSFRRAKLRLIKSWQRKIMWKKAVFKRTRKNKFWLRSTSCRRKLTQRANSSCRSSLKKSKHKQED